MKWFTKYWAVFGGIGALAIILNIVFSGQRFTDIDTLLWLHLATLLIHQFEEYVYPGGFQEFFNQNIYNKNPIIRSPLTDFGILFVNIALGWTAYMISAINGPKMLWLAIGLLGVTVLNGIMHTLIAIIKRKYNPGFISGLFILVPFGTWVLWKLIQSTSSEIVNSGIMIFVIGTALIPVSIFLTNLLQKKNT